MFVTIVPNFLELKKKFERVAKWESVCHYLLNDTTGQKTYEIQRGQGEVSDKRESMLLKFLADSNPTWRRVIGALRCKN